MGLEDNIKVTSEWRKLKKVLAKWQEGTVKKQAELSSEFEQLLSNAILYIIELIILNLIVVIVISIVITKNITSSLKNSKMD